MVIFGDENGISQFGIIKDLTKSPTLNQWKNFTRKDFLWFYSDNSLFKSDHGTNDIFRKVAELHGHYSAVELIFLDATKSSDTGYRWQTFNGTDLRFLPFRSWV